MEPTDYDNFDFGKRLTQYTDEVLSLAGSGRDESTLTEGQRIFLNAVRRERMKYANPTRKGYPATQLEQMESFTKTVGDLHNAFFDAGMHKISDCLYNRWKTVYEDTKKLARANGANRPAWAGFVDIKESDMPAFFDA